MELRVGNKYRLGRKIGSGSFGDIYLGMYQCLYVISVGYYVTQMDSSSASTAVPLLRFTLFDVAK